MKRFAFTTSIVLVALLVAGCGPSMKSVVKEQVPELRTMDTGTYDLGEFKNGQSTPFRMIPAAKSPAITITFRTVPESRRFDIVMDDGRVFKVDDNYDLRMLARVRLSEQSFYLKFRQDMRMIVVVLNPDKEQRSN